jgi:glycerol-3-phosphate responsive antiterminator
LIACKWHKSQVKTIEDIGGAMAFICWRINKNHLEDLINEGFVIEKEQVFNDIIEYL